MLMNFVEIMEKKIQPANSRQTNPIPSKDLASTSKFQSHEWKKENNGGKFQCNDGIKKSNQFKTSAGYDNKRPRQRGYVGKCQKEEIKKVAPQNLSFEEQIDKVISPGFVDKKALKSKNLNHMVNFYYSERRQACGAAHRYGKINRRHNKEIFLQANCQFVVKPEGEYAFHAVDADMSIDWGLVLQVKLFVNDFPSCPICLYPPKAAKITKCGHVYCWPCMLHYLSLRSEEDRWAKCPVCCEPVVEKDLRSVAIREVTKYESGMQITMKLMKKNRGEMILAPQVSWRDDLVLLRCIRDTENASYARLLKADGDYLEAMLESERSDLIQLLREEDSDSFESIFVTSALKQLESEQIDLKQNIFKKLEDIFNDTSSSSPEMEKPSMHKLGSGSVSFQHMTTNAKCYASAFDDEVCSGGDDLLPQEDCASQNSRSKLDTDEISGPFQSCSLANYTASCPNVSSTELAGDKKVQYFYQAADGQHIYLHSVNVRCLKAEYSSLQTCPNEITAVVVDSEEFSMTEELRHRFSFLSHLPVSCQFRIVELDLHPPLVTEESLKVVEEQIKRRRREREVRDKRDKRNAVKIQRIENKMMGFDPESTFVRSEYSKYREELNFNGIHNFPEIQKTPENDGLCTDASPRKKEEGESYGMSFAEMLKAGKVQPARNHQIVAGSRRCQEKEKAGDEESESESAEVPDFSVSWNVDLTKKLRESTLLSEPGEGTNSQKTKKKSKKGILLFATGAARPCYKRNDSGN